MNITAREETVRRFITEATVEGGDVPENRQALLTFEQGFRIPEGCKRVSVEHTPGKVVITDECPIQVHIHAVEAKPVEEAIHVATEVPEGAGGGPGALGAGGGVRATTQKPQKARR